MTAPPVFPKPWCSSSVANEAHNNYSVVCDASFGRGKHSGDKPVRSTGGEGGSEAGLETASIGEMAAAGVKREREMNGDRNVRLNRGQTEGLRQTLRTGCVLPGVGRG